MPVCPLQLTVLRPVIVNCIVIPDECRSTVKACKGHILVTEKLWYNKSMSFWKRRVEEVLFVNAWGCSGQYCPIGLTAACAGSQCNSLNCSQAF